MQNKSSFDFFPAVLQASHIQEILGISTGATYALLRSEGFPTITLGGKRKVVVKDDFIAWLSDERRKIKRVPILTIR